MPGPKDSLQGSRCDLHSSWGEMETAWLEYVKSRGADPLKEPLFEGAFHIVAQQIKNSSMEEIDCDGGIFPVDLSKE